MPDLDIAKHLLHTRRWPLGLARTFDFDPLDCQPRTFELLARREGDAGVAWKFLTVTEPSVHTLAGSNDVRSSTAHVSLLTSRPAVGDSAS